MEKRLKLFKLALQSGQTGRLKIQSLFLVLQIIVIVCLILAIQWQPN